VEIVKIGCTQEKNSLIVDVETLYSRHNMSLCCYLLDLAIPSFKALIGAYAYAKSWFSVEHE